MPTVIVERLPVVIVEWTDAARDPSFDGHPEDVPNGTVINHTVGFLLRENKQEVVVVADCTIMERTVRWPYGIPRKMIRKIVRLDEDWSRHFRASE